MTTLDGRDRTALLVVDVQQGVVDGSPRRDEVVANVGTLVERARDAGTAVVWVQHSDDGLVEGSPEWAYVPELERDEQEPLVHKHYGDSFEGTDLAGILEGLGVGHLVVAGAQSDACIRATIHGAFARGYDVTLVEDAHTTEDQTQWGNIDPEQVIAHTNLYWRHTSAPGRVAAVVPTAEVELSRS